MASSPSSTSCPRPRTSCPRTSCPPAPRHRSIAGCCFIGSIIFFVHGSLALDTVVIGGVENPWAGNGSSPGNLIDSAAEPGWIVPIQIDPEVDLFTQIRARGGRVSITSPNSPLGRPPRGSAEILQQALENIINGTKYSSGGALEVYDRKISDSTFGEHIDIDLGAPLGLNRIVFYPSSLFPREYLRAYYIQVNDGTSNLSESGRPDWNVTARFHERQNTRARAVMHIPVQFVEHLRLTSQYLGGFEIDEIELFGSGYVTAGSYLSRPFGPDDWGEEGERGALFGRIHWSAGAIGGPEKSGISVRTRSSANSRFWSPWSEPYRPAADGEGIQITSPAPRQFFQFEIRFESQDLEAAQRVDSLSFEHSPPVAQQLVAEIFPRQAQIGESREFVYAVQAFEPSEGGFDTFEIRTSAPIERLEKIQKLDAQGDILDEQVFEVDVAGLSLPYPDEEAEWALVSVDPNRFLVRFPPITEDGSVLKLRFDTSVLRYGIEFDGWGSSEGSDELPQPAVPGNAMVLTGDFPGLNLQDEDKRSNLTVLTDIAGVALMGAVEAVPNPFTPNGDGINDSAEIRFDVFKLTKATPVEVVVYDLSGRRIAVVFAGEIESGRHPVLWDGTDADDRLVPPGLYLLKLEVKADVKSEEVLGTVAVVY